jgi:glycosyltransferase involved in cell wall biosynthesis
MRILILHSRYATGSLSGENRVVDDEAALLSSSGHETTVWAPSYGTAGGRARGAMNAVWSQRAVRRVEELIETVRPDVVHVHNLFPTLSPAVLRASARRCAVVMTLHNFRLACLAGTLLRENRLCEDCVGHLPLKGVVHRCYRQSGLASAVLAASISVHRVAGSFSHVSLFVSVSEFVRDTLRRAGVVGERIRVKPNFAWPTDPRVGPGEYFLTLGRLSREKGLDVVVGNLPPAARLVVVGAGPERERLLSLATQAVDFRDAVPGSQVPELLRGARALLVPSRCYEGQPRVVLEAFAAGVPVVASRLGGLPELVQDGANGLLVEPGDDRGWRHAVERLTQDAVSTGLGAGAYGTWEQLFTPARALRNCESVYDEALARAASRTSQ